MFDVKLWLFLRLLGLKQLKFKTDSTERRDSISHNVHIQYILFNIHEHYTVEQLLKGEQNEKTPSNDVQENPVE